MIKVMNYVLDEWVFYLVCSHLFHRIIISRMCYVSFSVRLFEKGRAECLREGVLDVDIIEGDYGFKL